MLVAYLILILSTAMFLFYFQVTCQSILRREFERAYFQSIVGANRLEFPSVRQAIEEHSGVDFARSCLTLQCDFLALVYLLKHAANTQRGYTWEERLLMFYFRVVYLWMVTRRVLRLREERALLILTAILQYFANVVGQRVELVRFGAPAPSSNS